MDAIPLPLSELDTSAKRVLITTCVSIARRKESTASITLRRWENRNLGSWDLHSGDMDHGVDLDDGAEEKADAILGSEDLTESTPAETKAIEVQEKLEDR